MKLVKSVADLAKRVLRYFPLRRIILKATGRTGLRHPHYLNAGRVRGTFNGRRMVLIDGTDVATSYAPATFSVNDLEGCINLVSKRNECYAVVPQFRLKHAFSDNNSRLQQLQRDRRILVTPGKTLDGKLLTCAPNPFMLDVAKEFGAAIISNAGFDAERKLDPDYAALLKERQIGFEWTSNGLRFRAKNPLRTLEEILN